MPGPRDDALLQNPHEPLLLDVLEEVPERPAVIRHGGVTVPPVRSRRVERQHQPRRQALANLASLRRAHPDPRERETRRGIRGRKRSEIIRTERVDCGDSRVPQDVVEKSHRPKLPGKRRGTHGCGRRRAFRDRVVTHRRRRGHRRGVKLVEGAKGRSRQRLGHLREPELGG